MTQLRKPPPTSRSSPDSISIADVNYYHVVSTGGGEFIIGLTKDQARLDDKAGEFIGSISSVNMFSMVLHRSVIFWMMHGCGENIANAILPWSQFIDGFVGDVDIQRPALCRDSEG